MSSDVNAWEMHRRTLGEIIREVTEEIKTFIETRVQMLKEELRENMKAFQIAAPLMAIALALLGVSFLFFGFCLVALIAVAFPGNPYGWFFSFLIVSFLFAMIGAIFVSVALNTLRNRSVLPRRTIKVLREDRIWWQSEARKSI